MRFTPQQLISLKEAFNQELSLTELISSWGISVDLEVISIIYDLQSGTYTRYAKQSEVYIKDFTSEIVGVLNKYLENHMSILDCGTGEATTLIPILKSLGLRSGIAVDASISRLLWAQENATSANLEIEFAVSDIKHLPLADNSVDAVLTVHALEPNGGQEVALIRELSRVSRKFLFLIEPDFENGSVSQKERMKKLGYISGIDAAVKVNGLRVLEKLPLKTNSNDQNIASITVVETGKQTSGNVHLHWTDPIYKDRLTPFMNGLRSTFGLWYPVINHIPLLRPTDTQYLFSPPN